MNRTIISASAPQKSDAGHDVFYSWEGVSGMNVEVKTFRTDKFQGPNDEGYRPSLVKINGSNVWDFRTSGIRPSAELIFVDYEDCPMIVGLNSKFVLSVLPTQDFEIAQMINVAGTMKMIGGSSIERLLDLKIEIARGLELEPDFNKQEQALVQQRIEAEREARLAKKAAEIKNADTKTAKRLTDRAAFAHGLKSRKVLVTYTGSGDVRRGFPVTVEEFPRLLGENYYILVDAAGKPLQCFFLTSNKQVKGNMEVTATKPELKAVATTHTVSTECTIVVNIKGVATEVPLYKSAADVASARMMWRTPVVIAFREQSQGRLTGRYCVVNASSKECADIMTVKPVQQEAITA